jgi:glycosyltransferase involved in cell wall biosynthesis
MKVLFVSHATSLNGAPISLRILMTYFKRVLGWEIRILAIKGGPLLPVYQELAKTEVYQQFQLPRIMRSGARGFWEHFINLLRLVKHWRKTLKALKARIFSGAARKRQREHVENLSHSFREWQPDLIYSNTALNGTAIRSLKLLAPIVVHVRELSTSLTVLSGEDWRAFKDDPIHYFAVSGAVKTYMVNELGMPADKISVAPVALEVQAVLDAVSQGQDRDQLRKDLDVGSDEVLLGGVGNVDERKGSDLFLEAAISLIKGSTTNGKKLKFVWCGDGPWLQKLRSRVKALGFEKDIMFVGAKKDIYPWINAVDIMVTTSRDDPFPRVNLEAGLLKKPIICFGPSGGSREFVEKNAGLVLDEISVDALMSAILKLVSDLSLCEEFGENASSKVKELYDVSQVGANIRETLHSLQISNA